jgi:hypothetical protein
MDAASRAVLLRSLERDAERIALPFGLRYKSIDAERANVTSRYGVCFSDGAIRIRLRHAVTGHPLKYSSLVNTLCHELAHLRHFNHGPRFKAFYFELLDFARVQGIYRPGHMSAPAQATSVAVRAVARSVARSPSVSSSAPVQLSLL